MKTAGQSLLEDVAAVAAMLSEWTSAEESWIEATAKKYGVRFESQLYGVTDAQFEKFLKSFLSKIHPDEVEIQRAAMEMAREMLREGVEEAIDLSRIWKGIKDAAARTAKSSKDSFVRGYRRGAGLDDKPDPKAAAKPEPKAKNPTAKSASEKKSEPPEASTTKPPRAAKPDDKDAAPPKPAAKERQQARCKPLKGRPGSMKCVSASGNVYYKDSSGQSRRVK